MKMFSTIFAFGFLILTGCASAHAPPVDVGDKLVVPADHTFVIPPQGIRFSNGATIGVQPD